MLKKSFIWFGLSFLGAIYFLYPDKVGDLRTQWQQSKYIDAFALGKVFLEPANYPSVLKKQKSLDLVLEMLNSETAQQDLLTPKPKLAHTYNFLGLLAYKHAQLNQQASVSYLLKQPKGYRVLSALLYNEISPILEENLERISTNQFQQLNEDMQRTSNSTFRFGLLNIEDFRAYYADCVVHLEELTVLDLELLLYLHSHFALKVVPADFDKIIQKMIQFKPHYKIQIEQILAFRNQIERMLQVTNLPERTTVNVAIIDTTNTNPDYLRALLSTCGYLYDTTQTAPIFTLKTNTEISELHANFVQTPIYEQKTYKAHRTDLFGRAFNLKYTVTVTTENVDHYVTESFEPTYRESVKLQILRQDSTVAKLELVKILAHEFYDKAAEKYTVSAEQQARADSWFFAVPIGLFKN